MKRSATLLLVTLVISVVFTSCKKDEERASVFTFNEIDYQTTHGYYFTIPGSTQSTYVVYLCTPKIDDSGSPIGGYGDFVVLVFLSNSPEELLSGDYIHPTTMTGYMVLGFDKDMGYGVEYELSNNYIASASVNVHGNTYEFEYTMEMETGKKVTGYYKGSLEQITNVPIKSGYITGNE